jgi:hypothetical protein
MNGNRSIAQSIRGPITIITVGVLFALNNFTHYGFEKTWPVILIVFGLMSLWKRAEGSDPAPPPPRYSYTPPPPVYNAPPAAGTGRGGFGTSAPPRGASESPAETPPPAGGTV